MNFSFSEWQNEVLVNWLVALISRILSFCFCMNRYQNELLAVKILLDVMEWPRIYFDNLEVGTALFQNTCSIFYFFIFASRKCALISNALEVDPEKEKGSNKGWKIIKENFKVNRSVRGLFWWFPTFDFLFFKPKIG